MRMRTILITANALLACALVMQLVMHFGSQKRAYLMASWKDRPDSVEGTTKLAQSVVTGRVSQIRKADPITTKIAGEPGDVDKIAVEVVSLQLVDDDVKGNRKKGTTLELFHTGHSDAESPADRKPPPGQPPAKPAEGAVDREKAQQSSEKHMGVLFSAVMEDPGYKVGEEYVLFVRPGPKLRVSGKEVETQGIVSPEGRFKVKADKTLEPMSDRDFAKQLRGKPAKDLRDRAARAAGKQPGGGA